MRAFPHFHITAFVLAVLGAAMVSANAQSSVLLADDNGYISKNAPDTVQNSSLVVAMRSSNSFSRKIYLKFDLSDILEGAESFSDVALNLTTNGTVIGTTGTPATYNIYGIVDNDASWTGASITWNNAPKNGDLAAGVVDEGTVFLGSFSFTAEDLEPGDVFTIYGEAVDNYMNWAVGLLGDYYDTGETSATDSLITFIVAPVVANTVDGLQFYSVTNASVDDIEKPHLTFTVVPEPETVGLLLGLTMTAFVATRRIRRR